MTTDAKDTTVANLNSAKKQLTAFIIANTAPSGTAQWSDIEKVVQKRDQLTLQINSLLASEFPSPTTANLDGAIASVGQQTAALTALQKSLDTIAQVIAVAALVVQAAASLVQILTTL